MFLLRKSAKALKFFFMIAIVYGLIFYVFSFQILNREPVDNFAAARASHSELQQTINTLAKDERIEKQFLGKNTEFMSCFLTGLYCPESNPQKGVVGHVSEFFVFPFLNKPASGIYWAQTSLENTGLIPSVSAAEGIGFAAIKPISSLWKVFRDVAYLLVVVVIVAVGFLIMFRTKIDAQTAITAEQALPRIVITLLLITFSFPIAGFLIDLMYFLMAVTITIIAGDPTKQFFDVSVMQNQMLSAGPHMILSEEFLFPTYSRSLTNTEALGGWAQVIALFEQANIPVAEQLVWFIKLTEVGQSFVLVLPGIIQFFVYMLGFVLATMAAARITAFGNLFLSIFEGWSAAGFGVGKLVSTGLTIALFLIIFFMIALWAVPILLAVVILLTLVFLFVRVFVLVLTTYLKILLMIIFSPVYLLLDIIPGQSAFGSWFKSLFGELMTFPIISSILVLAHVLVNTVYASTGNLVPGEAGGFWAPPFLYGLNQSAYAFLIGTGLILLIPDIVKWFKDAIGIKPLPLNVGFGTFFQGGTTVLQGGAEAAGSFSSFGRLLYGDRFGVGDTIRKMFGIGGGGK